MSTLAVRIDWGAKLQHFLQTAVFCAAVAGVQIAFQPHRPFGPPLVYSFLIGTIIWAVIDLGRHLLPSSRETGWPTGYAGIMLVAGAIVLGYALGNKLGDAICAALGLFPPGELVHDAGHLRSGILITLLAGAAGSYWFYSRSKSSYLQQKMREAERHARGAAEAAGDAAGAAHAVQHAGQPARPDRGGSGTGAADARSHDRLPARHPRCLARHQTPPP